MPSVNLFVSEQHPVSRRWAVVEDDGSVAWLYLTEPGTETPVAKCWLYNKEVLPRSRAQDAVWFKWSQDGESVAVLFAEELVGFIATGHGFSKNLSKPGTLGSPIDRKLYENLFGAL